VPTSRKPAAPTPKRPHWKRLFVVDIVAACVMTYIAATNGITDSIAHWLTESPDAANQPALMILTAVFVFFVSLIIAVILTFIILLALGGGKRKPPRLKRTER
jgi:quinol-cytochrome oxidoreductase complex cytochrome b subunit